MTGLLRARDLPDGHPGWSFLTGRTPFFAARPDQRFSYSLYVPSSFTVETAQEMLLLVAVHGTGRRAERTRDLFADFAEERGVAVLAPLFPCGIEDPNDLHNYKLLGYRGIRFDEVLLSMVDDVGERWGLDVERFLLTGFSGGGQFAHRFAYLHPGRLLAVSAGAPGRVTLPDSEVWPHGLGDVAQRFGHEPDIEALRRVPMQVVVGAEDDASELLESVAVSSLEQRAGASRVDRARMLVHRLVEIGVPAELSVVEGAAHDFGAVCSRMASFLSEQL